MMNSGNYMPTGL